MLRCNSMNCNDPNATHHAACDCRETAHAAEVARLRAVIDVLLLASQEGTPIETHDGETWTVERLWDDAPSVLDCADPANMSLEATESLALWLRDNDVTECSALAEPEED